jgi:uncharacterized protein (DUF1015 family)
MTDRPAAPRTAGQDAGLVLTAFRGLRYVADRVADLGAVTSPPYDVVDDEKKRRLETAEPHNVVRLILPREAGRDRADTAGSASGRYAHAAELLRAWIAEGTLVSDAVPALYVYEQRTPTLAQRGLIGAVGLRDPDERVVLPHEDVLPGPVADRLELMLSTQANLEPIFLLYEGGGRASQIVDEVADNSSPALAASAAGAHHRLWALTDPGRLDEVADDLWPRQALIADGHHRYATYLRLRDLRRGAGNGSGPWDYGLALLVDSTAYPPEVRAIHRVVNGLSLDIALAAAAGHFRVRALNARSGEIADTLAELDKAHASGPAFVLARDDRRHLLYEPDRQWLAAATRADRPPDVRRLDATVMTDALLESLWGVSDDDARVRYEHDPSAALRHATQSDGIAVLLTPPSVSDVLGLAAAGARMPRKSTSFGPKPRTGLVFRLFDFG